MTAVMKRLLEQGLAPALVLAILIGPLMLVSLEVVDSFRDAQEAFLIASAWIFVLAMAVARALGGQAPLGGGAWSWCRGCLIALGAWVLIRNLTVTETFGAWAYAQTVVGFLLMGQATLDWIEGDVSRRNVIVTGLGVALAWELIIFALQASHASIGGPSFLDGTLNALNLTGKTTPIAFGTFGNENFLAEWLALVLPVLVGWSVGTRAQWPALILGSLGLFALIHSGCRAAVLGLVLGAPLAACLTYGRSFWKPARWWGDPLGRKFLIGAVLIVVVSLGAGGQALIAKLSDVTFSKGVQIGDLAPRLVAYRVARDMWYQHPLVGNGLGYYGTYYVDQLRQSYPEKVPTEIVQARFNQAHNEPLQSLAELGLVGLLLGLAASALWFFETSANQTLAPIRRMSIIWSVGALSVASVLGFPLHIPSTAAALMLVAALGLARPKEVQTELTAGSWRIPYALATACVVGVTGFLVIQRVAIPIVTSSYFQRLGTNAVMAGDFSTGVDLFGLAYPSQRYRVELLYDWMGALQRDGHDAASIAFYDAHVGEGMGEAAVVLRARALEHVGRTEEAVAAYKQVLAYYQPDHANYRFADKALARLQGGL